MAYCENDSNNTSNYMFTITNSLKFVGLNSRIADVSSIMVNKLMRKEGLPIAYEEIGIFLKLNI